MDKEGIKKLAKLSRLEIQEKEVTEYSQKISDILEYIDLLKGAADGNDDLIMGDIENRNIIREDKNPHESGIYTEDLLEAAPAKENHFVKVKKIL